MYHPPVQQHHMSVSSSFLCLLYRLHSTSILQSSPHAHDCLCFCFIQQNTQSNKRGGRMVKEMQIKWVIFLKQWLCDALMITTGTFSPSSKVRAQGSCSRRVVELQRVGQCWSTCVIWALFSSRRITLLRLETSFFYGNGIYMLVFKP